MALCLHLLRGKVPMAEGYGVSEGFVTWQDHEVGFSWSSVNPTNLVGEVEKKRMRTVLHLAIPIGSMYGIFTYIYHKNQPNVGEYTSPMDPMGYPKKSPDDYPEISSKWKLGPLNNQSLQERLNLGFVFSGDFFLGDCDFFSWKPRYTVYPV